MSQFFGGAGYDGATDYGLPSGGGAYKPNPGFAPVPGVYANHYPIGGSAPEPSEGSAWSQVGAHLLTTGVDLLAAKYLSRSNSPGNRTPTTSTKGEVGSVVERAPAPRLGGSPRALVSETAGAGLSPTVTVALAAGAVLLAVLLFRSGGV